MPTPTLDAFLVAVKDIGHKSPVRVKTVRNFELLYVELPCHRDKTSEHIYIDVTRF